MSYTTFLKPMNRKLITIVLILGYAIYGCDKEVFIDLPQIEEKLVANCIFSPESDFKVFLYRSNSQVSVPGAVIDLYQDSTLVETIDNYDTGLYKSSGIELSEGSAYSIFIKAPEFPDIWATDTIPMAVPILQVEHLDSAGTFSSGSIYASFDIEFYDPPGENNYYEIFILRKADTANLILWDSTETDVILNGLSFWEYEKQRLLKHNLTIFSPDQSIIQEGFTNGDLQDRFQDILFFSDDFFDGQQKKLRVNYWPYYSDPTTSSSFFVPERKFTVFLRSISEQYYKFRKTQKLYAEYKSQADIWKGTGDFVQIYSNLVNGYGLFAAYSYTSDSIKVANSFNY
jgi:hypothetical protein